MIQSEQKTQVVAYNISEAAIASMRARCERLSADTPQGYEDVRVALGELRSTRVAIEKRRVELKADALAYGRLVDSEAKRFTAMLVEIEEPLSQKKHDVDYEKARQKAEAEAARQQALEAKIRAAREAEEARLRVAREAEEAQLAEERARLEVERARFAEEQRHAEEAMRIEREAAQARQEAVEAAQRAKDEALRAQLRRDREVAEAAARAERDALEAERRTLAAAREKAEREEFERQAKIKAEAEAVAKAERDRLEAAERQAKLDALQPDIEKVRAFAMAIRNLPAPKPQTAAGKAMVAYGVTALNVVAANLEAGAKRWA